MKRLALTLLGFTLLLLVATPVWADSCAAALPAGSATGCGVVITVTAVNSAGVATAFTLTNAGNGNPYDGVEDTLIGIVNNSSGTLNSITLSNSTSAFGFDGDGICTFSSAVSCGTTGYEGPDNTFSNFLGATGTVNFTTGLAVGGSTWFSLEGTPSGIVSATTPEPTSIVLLGSGLAGILVRRFRKA